jgi:hypothetical protein
MGPHIANASPWSKEEEEEAEESWFLSQNIIFVGYHRLNIWKL